MNKLLSSLTFLLGLAAAMLVRPPTVEAIDTTILHTFVAGSSDGAYPLRNATLGGSTLYGVTAQGNWGKIFKVDTNGTGFGILHTFVGGNSDGGDPGSLILSGSTLYGMTSRWGSSDHGTVYKIDTNGSGFSIIHSFTGLDGDGPSGGGLILDGPTLYGMTSDGGYYGAGTVFKVNIDGSGYSILHSFNNSSSDGGYPYGGLILSGSTLYGMTNVGGSNSSGTVFKIGTNGNGYNVLHSFAGGNNDGEEPYTGSLTILETTLYGMTSRGGDNDKGTIFKINTDGNNFNLLHEFSGGINDGDNFYQGGTLTLSGSTLYGMTRQGGSWNGGTVFEIDTNGSGFNILHSFAGGSSDGAYPQDKLTLDGSTLYGVTYGGGSSNYGTLFSMPIPEPSTFALLATFVASFLFMACRRRKRK